MSYDEYKNAFSIIFVCEHICNVDLVFWGKQGKPQHLLIKLNASIFRPDFKPKDCFNDIAINNHNKWFCSTIYIAMWIANYWLVRYFNIWIRPNVDQRNGINISTFLDGKYLIKMINLMCTFRCTHFIHANRN